MKVKHECIKMSVAGSVIEYYIRYIKKHWWSRWKLVMDGNEPARYEKHGNEYIIKL